MREPVCPSCAALRQLVERLVASGIEFLDAGDAPSADLEDDEREVVSSDDGVVAPEHLDRVLK